MNNNTQQPGEAGVTSQPSKTEINAFFSQLRRLKAECRRRRVNKNDRTVVLISFCIDQGLDERQRIIGALKRLDLEPQHVSWVLDDRTGSNPLVHRWHRGTDRKYRHHELEVPTI